MKEKFVARAYIEARMIGAEFVCTFENSAWCGDVRDYEDSCELWEKGK